MSHSTRIRNTTFIHNGDARDGDVTINNSLGESVTIPYEDLEEFVEDVHRNSLISKIEQMDGSGAAILNLVIETLDKARE